MTRIVTITVTHGRNEDESTRDKDEFWEKFDFEIENSEGKLTIIWDFNATVEKRDEESCFVAGNLRENVRNKNGRRLINFCVVNNQQHIYPTQVK